MDFEKKFYSVSVFEHCKKSNSIKSLVFEEFSLTEVVPGFEVSKDKDELLALIEFIARDDYFILIKSNNLLILNHFFKYVTHINGLLKGEYVLRAKEELKIIDSRFNDKEQLAKA
jgi:hypothetical protein